MAKKKKPKGRQHSAYDEERRQELKELLSQARTPEEKQMIKKAFDVNTK